MTSKTILVTGANRSECQDPAPFPPIPNFPSHWIQVLAFASSEDWPHILRKTHTSLQSEAPKRETKLWSSCTTWASRLSSRCWRWTSRKDGEVDRAVSTVEETFGKLDVLVHNAAIGTMPAADGSDTRAVYNTVLDTNVTSVAVVTRAFMPLLRRSPDPRVVNVSSGRGSIHLLTTGHLPPTVSVAYSVSKTALNVLMLELAKQEQGQENEVLYQAAAPGHCKTAFNGFRGKRDPLEGARVVEELVCCERGKWEMGFWE